MGEGIHARTVRIIIQIVAPYILVELGEHLGHPLVQRRRAPHAVDFGDEYSDLVRRKSATAVEVEELECEVYKHCLCSD